jgi:hypothetical protein
MVVIRMNPAIIMLPAILLLYLSVFAHALDPGDIAAPSMSVPNMNMPKPIPKPNMDMPEPKPEPLVEPKSDPVQATNQSGNLSSNQTGIQLEDKPMDVSGKWSIRFDDGTGRSLDLSLWSPSGTAKIMGFGTLADEGKGNSVTARGSMTSRELMMIVKSATSDYAKQKYDEFDFDLILANETLSGTYSMKLGGEIVGRGNATAVRQ